MLFLAESLSSLWKYYFLVRMHCGVYIINSLLLSQLTVCAVGHRIYLIVSPGLYCKVFVIIPCGLQSRAAYIFNVFTLSKGIDDAQSFLGYVLSNKFFFRIRFPSASRANPSQEGL